MSPTAKSFEKLHQEEQRHLFLDPDEDEEGKNFEDTDYAWETDDEDEDDDEVGADGTVFEMEIELGDGKEPANMTVRLGDDPTAVVDEFLAQYPEALSIKQAKALKRDLTWRLEDARAKASLRAESAAAASRVQTQEQTTAVGLVEAMLTRAVAHTVVGTGRRV